MMPEEGISCQICGSSIGHEFRFCPNCGQIVNYTATDSGKVPLPLGIVLLGTSQVIISGTIFAGAIITSSPVTICVSLFNTIFGVLLFNGYWYARYLTIISAFLLALLYISIPVDLLIALVLILYLTRPEVVAYFEQRNWKPLKIKS